MKFLSCVIASYLVARCVADVDEHDGKCDSRFVECEAVCQFACDSDRDVKQIADLVNHHDVLRDLPWSHVSGHKQVDREVYKSSILTAFGHASATRERAGTPAPKSGLSKRLSEYASIAKSDPRLFAWPCLDHCQYECMHKTVAESGKVVKFFGKWPFQRVFIFQEFLSSLYSFFNAAPYIWFTTSKTFRTLTPIHFRVYAIIIALMWIASGVFHGKDTQLTMHIDYFSAFGGVVANCTLPLVLLVPRSFKTISVLLMSLLWLGHVAYMGFVEFDFDWNMLAAIVVAIAGTSLWTLWWFRNRKIRPHAWVIPAITIGLLPLFVTMELNDFPPGAMGLADAHSFWHLSTIPISCAWALFMYKESHFAPKQALSKKGA